MYGRYIFVFFWDQTDTNEDKKLRFFFFIFLVNYSKILYDAHLKFDAPKAGMRSVGGAVWWQYEKKVTFFACFILRFLTFSSPQNAQNKKTRLLSFCILITIISSNRHFSKWQECTLTYFSISLPVFFRHYWFPLGGLEKEREVY